MCLFKLPNYVHTYFTQESIAFNIPWNRPNYYKNLTHKFVNVKRNEYRLF